MGGLCDYRVSSLALLKAWQFLLGKCFTYTEPFATISFIWNTNIGEENNRGHVNNPVNQIWNLKVSSSLSNHLRQFNDDVEYCRHHYHDLKISYQLLTKGSLQKKNRKIYDDLSKGGWVANSKHDFFRIKNYDIIKGGWVTDFHVIIFKLSFFHKSPYDFPFF